jgi:hypothetical protein
MNSIRATNLGQPSAERKPGSPPNLLHRPGLNRQRPDESNLITNPKPA